MKKLVVLVLLLFACPLQAQVTSATVAILDSAATRRSVKYADASYAVARNATVGEATATEFAVFNADTTVTDYTVSRGFLMLDLTDLTPAVRVDSARLFMYLLGDPIDFQDSDSTHVVEGTYTGGYEASDTISTAWYSQFTGWTDSSAYGVVNYTEPFVQDTSDNGWQSRLFTQAGLDTLLSKIGADTIRMALLNGQDIANYTPTSATQGLTSWRSTPANSLPYLTIYYRSAAYDTVVSASSGGLLLNADTTLDYQVHDSTHASSVSTTTMNIGYRTGGNGKYHVNRTALTFATDQLTWADSIVSASLFIYPTIVVDSLDIVVGEGTFSGAIATDWFNDFTGWVDGAPYTAMNVFVDSTRIASTDTSSWVELPLTTAGKAALLAAMANDSLRMMILSSMDVNRSDFPTDSSRWGVISATTYKPYLMIDYTTLAPPAVITNKDVDTTFFVGGNVYATLGARIDSVGDGLDSVGFRYYLVGDAGNPLYTVSDSSGATWVSDSFFLNTSSADTLTIDTFYVVTAFAVNRANRIYSTVNDTISTEYAISTLWETISTLPEDSIIANPVRAIWPDAIDRLWFGTAMGLYRQDSDTTIARYVYDDSSFAQKSRNNILAGIGLPDSTIFTGSPVGLTRHDTLSFTSDSLITEGIIPDSVVWTLVPDSGGVSQAWVANGMGYVYIFGDTVETVFDSDSGLIGDRVYDVAFDSTSSAWLATDNGVSRIIGGYWIDYTTTNSWINGNVNYAIAICGVDSSIWFGGDDGLVQFDNDTTWTDWSDSLVNRRVKDIVYDNVNLVLWIATDSGLVAYQPDTPNGVSWRRYYPASTSDSLPQYRILSVYPDTAGRVWVGHSAGVTRLTETFN
ncbi:MAG: hypothetical protein C4542_08080 [Dehalococcoidia bacterium]|nr:MAG: hypothetical protein C4542_08080 [Dehalococcoidia bacterium]